MFKDDKMMTLLTGLVLAIFAGTMVQYGDSIISLLSGQTTESTEDDYFTALAGAEQQLDVLANDAVRGPLAVTTVPACGELRPGIGQMLFYRSDASCVGEQTFTYCVATAEGCADKSVTISVVGSTAVAAAGQTTSPQQTPVATPARPPDGDMQTAAAAAATSFAPQPVNTANGAGSDAGSEAGSDSVGANSSAPQIMVDPGASMASANDSAPEVDMVVAGIRPPMLAAPQIDEIVAPNDAAAQLRSEMARGAALPDSTPASSPAVEAAVDATLGQMDTSFTAPSLGDEGVSLGRSVVVAGATFGGSAGGPEVEGASDVAIAGVQPSSPVATAPAPALSSAAPWEDWMVNQDIEIDGKTYTIIAIDGANGIIERPYEGATAAGIPFTVINRYIDLPADCTSILGVARRSNTRTPNDPGLLSPLARTNDAVEVLGIGPNVLEEAPQLAALDIPTETAASIIRNGAAARFAGAQVLLASATLPPSDSVGAATDMAVQVLDAFPTLAAVQISDVRVELDSSNDAALTASSAPLVNPANEPGTILPPVADTSTSSPTALVATATTLLPSLESGDTTPARPRLLMRHVAMSGAPGALDGAAGDLTAGPNIDSSTAPPLQVASLVPEATGPSSSLPGETACDISLDTLLRPGAEIELIIGAACRPNQMFTVTHAAIAFSEMTGADGTAIVQFPALERSADISVEFADGASSTTSLIVPDTETILRAGISWRGVADIELNAYEFGAPANSPGHISPQTPRDYRAARILGGGFLTELGSLDVAGAAHASVYSMPLSRATPDGIITLSLRMGDAGADCGGSTELTTFRSENAAAFARQQSVQLAACGAVLPTAELMGLVDDLWTAAR